MYLYTIMPRLSLILLLIPLSLAFHCAFDEEVTGNHFVKETTPVPLVEKPDLFDWVNFKKDPEAQEYYEKHERPLISIGPYHTWFYLFGYINSAQSNSLITASVNSGEKFFKAEVNCKTSTYTISSHRGIFRKGQLGKNCEKGPFDLVLKIVQRKSGFFMFNGMLLDDKIFTRQRKINVSMTDYTPMSFTESLTYTANLNGEGKMDRVAIGKCIAYPSSIKKCDKINEYLAQRKILPIGRPVGLYNQGYRRKCWPGNKDYFNYMDDEIHGDVESIGKPYCCCINMLTGEIATSKRPVYTYNNEGNPIISGYKIERCVMREDYDLKEPCKLRCQDQWDANIFRNYPLPRNH